MALEIKTTINGIDSERPLNIEGLEIETNFDQGNVSSTITLNEVELGVGDIMNANDPTRIALNWIEGGLNGGPGVLEMVPLQLRLSDGVSQDLLFFDGGIDLFSGRIQCAKVVGNIIERGGLTWLEENGNFTFEYLFKGLLAGQPGKIDFDDQVSIPYVISELPNWKETAIVLLSIFVVINEIKDSIQSLIDYAVQTSNPFQAASIASIVLRVAYIVGLIVTAVKFIIDLFDLVIQPVKYHAGMTFLKHCQKGAEFLGKEFRSSILEVSYKNQTLLPQKRTNFINEDKNSIFGFLTPEKNDKEGFFKGTFGELLLALKEEFNAKILIDDTTIRLERRDYNPSNDLYILPEIDFEEYTFNSEEYNSNILIKFQEDLNDKNTIQPFTGNSVQIQTVPKVIFNKDLVLNKGLKRVSIPFALGREKTDLTVPEKIFDAFFKSIDKVLGTLVDGVNLIISGINLIIKQINKIIKALKTIGINLNIDIPTLSPIQPPSFGNLISDRLGMLLMETDFVSVPKVLMIREKEEARNNKLLAENSTKLNALYIWENFYSIDSFDSETYSNHNQHKIYEINEPFPFCFEDYQKVVSNNRISTDKGVGELISLKWNPDKKLATNAKFKIKEVYTKNLKTVIIEPNGK